MPTGENNDPCSSYRLNLKTYAVVALISVIYFADVFLKASRKCFWFDELFTVYLCRLHYFNSIWVAVVHGGADFNPPLLHLLTRMAQATFGDGLIATRLPAMVGVWLFCVCLFFFVARRAGPLPGLIAGTFPFFTLVQYYAYEARAHGIVLGWCGLTLICWQRNGEGRSRSLWLAGFGLCLLGALLTHVYAVYILFPFFLVELYNLFRKGSPDWGVVAVSVFSLVSVTFAVYLPMFRIYRATVPLAFFAASHDTLQRFMVAVIGPAIGVLVIALALFALEAMGQAQQMAAYAPIPQREMLVALGFACIPIVGLLGSKVSHGPFIDRYFLSGVAGCAILLGFASSNRPGGSWTARALAAGMFLSMIGDLVATGYLTIMNRVVLIEPSAGFALSTNPANPMQMYETVSVDQSGLDIIVLRQTDYLYFVRYASPSIVSRLCFGAPGHDLFLAMYQRLAKGARINLRVMTFDQFLATHDRFLAYDGADSRDTEAILTFAAAGYSLKSTRADMAGIMYEYEKGKRLPDEQPIL